MALAKITTDHNEIRQWAEARGGKPVSVKGTKGGGAAGVLRINFPGFGEEESFEEISWDEFFQKFEDKKLAFLYQEKTSEGKESRFFKLINRTEHAARKHRKEPVLA